MTKYTKQIFDLIKNESYDFYRLLIDEVCLFDEFVQEIEKVSKLKYDLTRVYRLMENFSKMLMPKDKFRHIKNVSRNDIYEFKYGKIRVYVILDKENEEIFIVDGSDKKKQEKVIKRISRNTKDLNISEL